MSACQVAYLAQQTYIVFFISSKIYQVLILHTSVSFIIILYIIHLHGSSSKSSPELQSEHVGSLSVLSVSSAVVSCLLESSIIIICGLSPVSTLTVGMLGSFPNLTEVQLAKACLGLTGASNSSYICTLSALVIYQEILRYIGYSYLRGWVDIQSTSAF